MARNVKYYHKKDFSFLDIIPLIEIRGFIRNYLGELPDEHYGNEPKSIEVFETKDKGKIYKVNYLTVSDLDLIVSQETVYLGEFGFLFQTEKGFQYKPLSSIETKNWFKFMHNHITDTDLQQLFVKNFTCAHKLALDEARHTEVKQAHEYLKKSLDLINKKYDNLDEDVEFFDIKTYLN